MLGVYLPTAGVEIWLPGLVLFGLGIGFLIGMFGVGGGFIITPLLHIVFGIPYPVAVGSSLLQIFLNGLIAVFRHWRAGNVDARLGLLLAAGALGGTEIGVRMLGLLGGGGTVSIIGRSFVVQDLLLNLLFLLLLSSVSFVILRETSRRNPGAAECSGSELTGVARRLRQVTLLPTAAFPRSGIDRYSLAIPLLIGLGVGVLTGLMGVGGGFLNFPILIYVIGVPTHLAVGTSVFQILFASGFGAFRHSLLGNVEPLLVAIMFLGSFAGVQGGVWAVGKLKPQRVQRFFAWVVLAGVLIILWDLGKRLWL